MIEINLLNILGTAVLGNMIAHWYLPIQPAKRAFIKFFTFLPFISTSLDKALNCSKCSSFILGIALFLNIPAAALVGLLGLIINFIIDYINYWYERE
jgi:hypothetical protein